MYIEKQIKSTLSRLKNNNSYFLIAQCDYELMKKLSLLTTVKSFQGVRMKV